MTHVPVCIAGMGVITSIGDGLPATIRALQSSRRGLTSLTLFPATPDRPSPAGEIAAVDPSDPLPRTHQLARIAGDEAFAGSPEAPDAIVIGTTTGGMSVTEALLEQRIGEPERYAHHAAGSVAEDLACRYGCTGPVITVSTACASGAAAIAIAAEMVRCGMAKRVLAGGADGLSRFTYFGFKSLQLIDPSGARPFDRDRRGMSLGEGAGMLLLTRDAGSSGLEILGTGLSCDAYHPTAPHPLGEGAISAMAEALRDAGLSPGDIDYINLHGTGTPDNDRAEARAVLSLFGEDLPPVSSTKGSIGHTLAAAGAIEAVIAAAGIREGFIPPNVGFEAFDPDIGIPPIASPTPMPIRTAMSNAFGFGGNNAALIVGTPRQPGSDRPSLPSPPPLTVSGYACVSGAGRTGETMDAFFGGRSCSGRLPEDAISAALPPRTIRRLKRLSKLVLSLAAEACGSLSPSSISIGTGWGAMSETYDFLMRLFETGMQFPSPTDFIGSVHNAPGGQAAMHLNVKGANVTTTGGDYSFEQALLAADLLTRRTQEPVLLIGADEAHAALSPLFDASVRLGSELSDGGGGFLIARNPEGGGIGIELIYYRSGQTENVIGGLIEALGGPEEVLRRYAAVPAGIPAARRNEAEAQLAAFLSLTGFTGPVIDYRRHTGDFATAAAIAAAAAVRIVEIGAVPGPLASGNRTPLEGKGILLLGLGDFVTAVRIYRR